MDIVRQQFHILRGTPPDCAPHTLSFDDRIHIWDPAAMDAIQRSLDGIFFPEVMQGIGTNSRDPYNTSFAEQVSENSRHADGIRQSKKGAKRKAPGRV
jgi:hypothetical protein